MAVAVDGLQELNRAFKRAPDRLKREWRNSRRDIGEPVRAAAERAAPVEIRNMPATPRWSQMRTGVTQKSVYVAPKARNRGGSKRSNLAGLLMDRAMQPALEQRKDETIRAVERMLDTVGRDWEKR